MRDIIESVSRLCRLGSIDSMCICHWKMFRHRPITPIHSCFHPTILCIMVTMGSSGYKNEPYYAIAKLIWVKTPQSSECGTTDLHYKNV
jgi:hypothetical protein